MFWFRRPLTGTAEAWYSSYNRWIPPTVKRKLYVPVLCAIACLTGFSDNMLTWSSKSGHSFKGSVVFKDATTVNLRGPDGRTMSVPLNISDGKSLQQLDERGGELPICRKFTGKNRENV